jgi:hypothetical protein
LLGRLIHINRESVFIFDLRRARIDAHASINNASRATRRHRCRANLYQIDCHGPSCSSINCVPAVKSVFNPVSAMIQTPAVTVAHELARFQEEIEKNE